MRAHYNDKLPVLGALLLKKKNGIMAFLDDLYLWGVTAMAAVIAVNTLWRIYSERHRFLKEELTDEDRSFAWRIVIFLVFPLLNFLDLRATTVACDLLGGSVKSWSYGLIWFHVEPVLARSADILPAYFAGVILQMLLAILLLPALLFRPHPFLSCLVTYTVAFIFGANIIADPLLSASGLGSPRWQMAYGALPDKARLALLALHLSCVGVYCLLMFSQRVRLMFASLSRPVASEELKKALIAFRSQPDSPRLSCQVGLLYDRAGLRRRAKSQLSRLKSTNPDSLYTAFLEAMLDYRRRDYTRARKAFLKASDYPGVDGRLKASLLSAAGCAAFASDDITGALNCSERALEFDDYCLVARMVKVDVFLRQGKKTEAGQEILLAMREGPTIDLERKVPLDADWVFAAIVSLEERLGDRVNAPQREILRSSREKR